MDDSAAEISSIVEAINKLGIGWSLCFIGEDQAAKLGALTQDLKRSPSSTGDGKRIASGFSYWGIGPTIAWLNACKDHLYPVMKESITSFGSLWTQLEPDLNSHQYHYVSLGVGTGEKDKTIILDLYKTHPSLFYFPVDMSPEMLRLGAREALGGTLLPRSNMVPVQIDFSFLDNIRELRELLDRIAGKQPILFALLGNTLSNFEEDHELLRTISHLIRAEDRLLLEVAYTDSLTEEAQHKATLEYDNSRMFKEFVSSALLQNTDLHLDIDSVSFQGCAEGDRAILIKSIYRNQTGSPIRLTLPDRTTVDFLSDDTIRIATMRKYTRKGIDQMIAECGFQLINRAHKEFPHQRGAYRFGTEVMLLSHLHNQPAPAKEWDIFLAHPSNEKQLAEQLYGLLHDRCSVFMDSKSLKPGDDWDIELPKAQQRSLMTVVLVSSHTDKAHYQREEITAALDMARREEGGHRVVPIFCDEEARQHPPYGLRLKNGILLPPGGDMRNVAEQLLSLIAGLKKA